MKPKRKSAQPPNDNPSDIWQSFVQSEVKKGSKIGKAIESSTFGSLESKVLKLYFEDDQLRKQAQGQRDKIQQRLSSEFRLLCDRIEFITGVAPIPATSHQVSDSEITLADHVTDNPLQALYWVEPLLPVEEEAEPRLHILRTAVAAERSCAPVYQHLANRTKELSGDLANTLTVQFDWRLRVGGARGFRDLLLPILHPVFGVPYIPASSLKGVTRAWAEKNVSETDVKKMLGKLEDGLGRVEFLDAFPTSPCLSLDVATPQWHWKVGQHPQAHTDEWYVEYQPDPHPLVSLKTPEFIIGVRPTQLGTQNNVQMVKSWLEASLNHGLGSRVSSGYGYAKTTNQASEQLVQENSVTIPFVLWTQGLYGNNPPTKSNDYQGTPEFRSTALRGVLRYWFRAIALALYPADACQAYEEELFGSLGKQGLVLIRATVKETRSEQPYAYEGQIYLTVKGKEKEDGKDNIVLKFVQQLLMLASCLGGVGHGSRRPIHKVKEWWRGCYWELSMAGLPLTCNKESWESLINNTQQLLKAWKPSNRKYSCFLGNPGARRQDVLDDNAQVWIMPSLISRGKHPKQVNWLKEAKTPAVRGAGLNLLYSSSDFKGKSLDNPGNPRVGGALQKNGNTPSYVWIKSVFLNITDSYQVITIFGADNRHRGAFAEAVQKAGGILVWGKPKKKKKVIKVKKKP